MFISNPTPTSFIFNSFDISFVIVPTVLQKYPVAHICCPQNCLLMLLNSSCIFLELLPFIYCIICATDKDGVHLSVNVHNLAVYSLLLPLFLLHRILASVALVILKQFFPVSIFLLYFVIHTIWYCISYWVWAPFCSCITLFYFILLASSLQVLKGFMWLKPMDIIPST